MRSSSAEKPQAQVRESRSLVSAQVYPGAIRESYLPPQQCDLTTNDGMLPNIGTKPAAAVSRFSRTNLQMVTPGVGGCTTSTRAGEGFDPNLATVPHQQKAGVVTQPTSSTNQGPELPERMFRLLQATKKRGSLENAFEWDETGTFFAAYPKNPAMASVIEKIFYPITSFDYLRKKMRLYGFEASNGRWSHPVFRRDASLDEIRKIKCVKNSRPKKSSAPRTKYTSSAKSRKVQVPPINIKQSKFVDTPGLNRLIKHRAAFMSNNKTDRYPTGKSCVGEAGSTWEKTRKA